MSTANNPIDTTITLEQEKAKLTFANGPSNGEPKIDNFKTKPTISADTEREILKEIQKHCNNWKRIANTYLIFIILFGLSAVTTSVLVSIYTGADAKIMSVPTIKILAGISTISLAVLTAFNLVTNSNNARNAWRSLNAAMLLYKAGSLSIQQLIEQYQKGENQVGNLNFNYGPNADKSGTYTQDVANNDEKKQNPQQGEKILKSALEKQKEKAPSELDNKSLKGADVGKTDLTSQNDKSSKIHHDDNQLGLNVQLKGNEDKTSEVKP